MSYNKTTWSNGDIITAEKMNNIENGIKNISGGINIFNFNDARSNGLEVNLPVTYFVGAYAYNTLDKYYYVVENVQDNETSYTMNINNTSYFYFPDSGAFVVNDN